MGGALIRASLFPTKVENKASIGEESTVSWYATNGTELSPGVGSVTFVGQKHQLASEQVLKHTESVLKTGLLRNSPRFANGGGISLPGRRASSRTEWIQMHHRMGLPRLLVLIGFFCATFATAFPEIAAAGSTPLSSRRIASGVARPVLVTAPAGDYERLFIVQQQGLIRIYDMVNGNVLPTPFLNIDALVGGGTSGGDERGFLGLAFHPDYANNGFFYVSYTNNGGTSTIARYTVSATNPNQADLSSAQIILTQSQPFTNHNGGMIAFSPIDGYLYVGFGDGGSGNDPQGNSQNNNTRLGKMLRIDVDGGTPFAIPPDNPFVGPGAPLDEIWATGLRNPWRFSFDRDTGDMYIADVGQFSVEEISFQPASSAGGENYGWRCMEGNSCTGLGQCTCFSPALTDPIQTYNHSQGCSITGGYVYRGCSMPDMHGIYFYSDFCSATMWTFEYDGTSVTNFMNRTSELNPPGPLSIAGVSGFGEDAYGEIYVCDHSGGEIFKIVPADIDMRDCDGNFVDDMCEIAVGAVIDCNNNGASDICDINDGLETDCNGNGVPDSCEIAAFDCNSNGEHDACEIDAGTADDCNADMIPDDCQIAGNDCNQNGTLDSCDIDAGAAVDCDNDLVPDSCQLAAGTAEDCNNNSLLDSCDIELGLGLDCDGDGALDECQIDADPSLDCNSNQLIDSCDISLGNSLDVNNNQIPDECEAAQFVRGDCNDDGGYDLADAIYTLDYLFGGGGTLLNCEDACDANDSESLDLSDPIFTLSNLFSGGPTPPSPHPGCGPDPQGDTLGCDTSSCP